MIKVKKLSKVGIVGLGIYLPEMAMTTKEIDRVWREEVKTGESLGIVRKTVAASDEDSITMAVEAGSLAIKMARIKPAQIGTLLMGSESHPYAVKPSGTVVGEILNLANDYFCADLQFACKAATAGMQMVAAFIEAGMIEYGLVIGSDKAQARPGDALEYTAGSAAVAFLLGPKENSVAELSFTTSYCSDTPDFWRRQLCAFPCHLGRFTGKPAYFKHVYGLVNDFLRRTRQKITDFDHVVFHMPNAKFPKKAAVNLGVNQDQLKEGLTVSAIGNPYSASSLIGLARVLEKAKAGQKILMVSYGSGAGSDGFIFRTTKNIKTRRPEVCFDDLVKNLKEIDYSSYLKQMEMI